MCSQCSPAPWRLTCARSAARSGRQDTRRFAGRGRPRRAGTRAGRGLRVARLWGWGQRGRGQRGRWPQGRRRQPLWAGVRQIPAPCRLLAPKSRIVLVGGCWRDLGQQLLAQTVRCFEPQNVEEVEKEALAAAGQKKGRDKVFSRYFFENKNLWHIFILITSIFPLFHSATKQVEMQLMQWTCRDHYCQSTYVERRTWQDSSNTTL